MRWRWPATGLAGARVLRMCMRHPWRWRTCVSETRASPSDDLRLVARGWRWTRRRIAPRGTVDAAAVSADPLLQTAWARSAIARGVRDAALGAALGPLLRASLDISVAGREYLDRVPGPAVFVANHTSHLDALVALHALPLTWRRRTVIAAASDYFFSSWWRSILAALALNAVPVERYAGAGDQDVFQRLLGSGWSVLAFPEGTRSRDGTLQRFHHGPARLALDTRRPAVPVAIRGTFRAMPAGVRWPRPSSAPSRVHVRFGSAVWPAPGERTRDLTARLQHALQRVLVEDSTTWWTSQRSDFAEGFAAGMDAARWRRVWTNTAQLPPNGRPPIWPRC